MKNYIKIILILLLMSSSASYADQNAMSSEDYEYIGLLLFANPDLLEVSVNLADKDGVLPTKKYIESVIHRDDFKELIQKYRSGNKMPKIMRQISSKYANIDN